MKKILVVVGTRPQFIKARFLVENVTGFDFTVFNTSQHYDKSMRDYAENWEDIDIFSNDGVPRSDRPTLSNMIGAVHDFMFYTGRRFDAVMVIGDCDATVAGAVAASEAGFALIHLEAGLRSYRKEMREEKNRVMVDYLSDLNLCPTETARQNLLREGNDTGVVIGNILTEFTQRLLDEYTIHNERRTDTSPTGLFTIHRPELVDNEKLFTDVYAAILKLTMSQGGPTIYWPVHPRIKTHVTSFINVPKLKIIEPLTHRKTLQMALNADFVITDSGGLQIETSVLGVPCATLRTETEHTETLTYGTNRLIAPDRIDLTSTLVSFYNQALTARGRRGIPPHEPSVVTRISEALRTWFKV